MQVNDGVAAMCLCWLNQGLLAIGLQTGQVVIINAHDGSAIEVARLQFNPVWDMVALDDSTLALATDSGHVFLLQKVGDAWQPRVLTHQVRQSALGLSLYDNKLVVRFQRAIKILRLVKGDDWQDEMIF